MWVLWYCFSRWSCPQIEKLKTFDQILHSIRIEISVSWHFYMYFKKNSLLVSWNWSKVIQTKMSMCTEAYNHHPKAMHLFITVFNIYFLAFLSCPFFYIHFLFVQHTFFVSLSSFVVVSLRLCSCTVFKLFIWGPSGTCSLGVTSLCHAVLL